MGTALADKNVPCKNKLAVGTLDSETLGLGITTVFSGSYALFMGEQLDIYLKHSLHLRILPLNCVDIVFAVLSNVGGNPLRYPDSGAHRRLKEQPEGTLGIL